MVTFLLYGIKTSFHPTTMYKAQTLIPRIQDLRMTTPIFILGIKSSIQISDAMDLHVIHGNGCIKALTLIFKERWCEGGRRDWVERKR